MTPVRLSIWSFIVAIIGTLCVAVSVMSIPDPNAQTIVPPNTGLAGAGMFAVWMGFIGIGTAVVRGRAGQQG